VCASDDRDFARSLSGALLLSEIDGLPLKEVADRLNISLPGAKSRLHRDRERLKNIFLVCCYFKFDRREKPIDLWTKEGCARVSC
jgi:RNA polymerase sigma-70 factor, ECF subfamily